ncbi:DnaJ family domain-containing protein [Sinomonas albida]|uniref:DnaJ family domain-containing protein n=1 Tax=Sinomonas albida TaxID=369942 RepID=UPI0010A7E499|nr:DUF1992 domain-containing protein [Sinomonas albida]
MNARGADDRQHRLERAAELRAAGHGSGRADPGRAGPGHAGPGHDGRSDADRRQEERANSGHANREQANPEQLNEVRREEELREKRRKFDSARRADYLIRDAMARGEFDHLQYAGKPIPGLGGTYDPDWWIKGLIQREHLTGLGPKALLLRVEDAELDTRLDTMRTEREVRAAVEDFNARVIDARRQLEGGPPVVTKTRDVDGEAQRWRERRDARIAAQRAAQPAVAPTRTWWRRLWRGQA